MRVVQNKPGFIADCTKAMIATGILGEDPLEVVHEIKLGKIEINGGLAEAMLLPRQGKANRPAMIFFRLEDVSWRIDIVRHDSRAEIVGRGLARSTNEIHRGSLSNGSNGTSSIR